MYLQFKVDTGPTIQIQTTSKQQILSRDQDSSMDKQESHKNMTNNQERTIEQITIILRTNIFINRLTI